MRWLLGRPRPSKGEENFGRCALKRLNASRQGDGSYRAELTCPQLDEGGYSRTSSLKSTQDAVEKLATFAGQALCEGCRLVDMDEVAAYEYVARRDTARAAALRARIEVHEAKLAAEAIDQFMQGRGQGPEQ